MKLPRILPALLVASMALVAACGGDDDDAASMTGDDSGADAEGSAGEGPDGMPSLFELSACDTIPAEDLDAAGLEPEPSNTLGEAGSSTGNGCWWQGGMGARDVMVGFVLSDLESDYFEEVITDDETEVDGLPARRITGSDDLEGLSAYPACGVRIEVEPDVILMVEVAVSRFQDSSANDERRLDQACAILDYLVPIVSAQIPGSEADGDNGSPDEDEGAGDGEEGTTVPANAEITSELLCEALVNTEIPAPGFELALPAPQVSTAEGICTWESLGGGPAVRLWYESTNILSSANPVLETDGREGSIVQADSGRRLPRRVRACARDCRDRGLQGRRCLRGGRRARPTPGTTLPAGRLTASTCCDTLDRTMGDTTTHLMQDFGWTGGDAIVRERRRS